MAGHYNGLSPAEAERLACLAEECGEVVKAIGKILRHGYAVGSPLPEYQNGLSNRGALQCEIGDVQAIVALMGRAEDIDLNDVRAAELIKIDKLPKWTHHQENSIDRHQPDQPQ